MPPKKTTLQAVPRKPAAGERRDSASKHPKPQLVSGKWLLAALGVTIAAAMACAWLALCLLFWQGSWQLLYHPSTTVNRTPTSAGLPFDAVAFAVTDAGAPRLKGWWIPAAQGSARGRLTVLVFHSQDGNLSDTVDTLAQLHSAGVNVFAFDYRGYGGSQPAHPSERTWREDADSALDYLTGTRQIDMHAIVLFGNRLGANLALEVAAAHPELAGVVVDAPIADPTSAIFNDARARLVPARLLVHDRYDFDAAAVADRTPVLWLEPADPAAPLGSSQPPPAYRQITSHKMIVWVNSGGDVYKQTADTLSRWLDDLPAH